MKNGVIFVLLCILLYTSKGVSDSSEVIKRFDSTANRLRKNQPLADMTLYMEEYIEFHEQRAADYKSLVETFIRQLGIAEHNFRWEQWFELKGAKSFTAMMEYYAIITHLTSENEEKVRQKISDVELDRVMEMSEERAFRWTFGIYNDWLSKTIESLHTHDPVQIRKALSLIAKPSRSYAIRGYFLSAVLPELPMEYRASVLQFVLSNDVFFKESTLMINLGKEMSKPEWFEYPRLIKMYFDRASATDVVDHFLTKIEWASSRIPIFLGSENTQVLPLNILEGEKGLTLLEQSIRLGPDVLSQIIDRVLILPEYSGYRSELDFVFRNLSSYPEDKRVVLERSLATFLTDSSIMSDSRWPNWMGKLIDLNSRAAFDIVFNSKILIHPKFLDHPQLFDDRLRDHQRFTAEIEKAWMENEPEEKIQIDKKIFEKLGVKLKRNIYRCNEVY